jgi:LDH2 family malate/lactate/ureidoglycolate dehydrogenase
VSSISLPIAEVESVIKQVFKKCGLPDEELVVLVDTLLDAELRGIKTHGLLRVPMYYKKMEHRSILIPTIIERYSDRQAVSCLDGHHGLGQWIAYKGMEEAVNKAAIFGIGAVSVRNSQHFGTAGYYAKMAADRNMIGLVFTNASPRLAPWGGKTKIFGNNPLSIGIPT